MTDEERAVIDSVSPEEILPAIEKAERGPDLSEWAFKSKNRDLKLTRELATSWARQRKLNLEFTTLEFKSSEDWRKLRIAIIGKMLDQQQSTEQSNEVKLEEMKEAKENASREEVATDETREKLIRALINRYGFDRTQAEQTLDKLIVTYGEGMAQKTVSQAGKIERYAPNLQSAHIETAPPTEPESKFRSQATKEAIKQAGERAESRGYDPKRETFLWLSGATIGELTDYLRRYGILEGYIPIRELSPEEYLDPELASQFESERASLTGRPTSANIAAEIGSQLAQEGVARAVSTAAKAGEIGSAAGEVAAGGATLTEGAAAVAAGGAATAGAGAAAIAGEGIAAGGVAAGGTVAAAGFGPVGLAIMAGKFLKDLPGNLSKLVNWFKKALFGKTAQDAASYLQRQGRNGLDALGPSGSLGLILGLGLGVLGSFFGFPLFGGIIAGGILGPVVGRLFGGILGSSSSAATVGILGSLGAGAEGPAVTTAAVGVITGTGVSSIILWVFIGIMALVGSFFLFFTNFSSAFAQPPNQAQMGPTAPFGVAKTGSPTHLNNFSGQKNHDEIQTVTYTVTIKNTQEDITIKTATDKTLDYKSGKVTTIRDSYEIPGASGVTIKQGETKQLPAYTLSINGKDYGSDINDSNLINTVSIVATIQSTGQDKTQTTSFTIPIGNPPIDKPPYGFPIAGLIFTLDDELIPQFGRNHCGDVHRDTDPPNATPDHWACEPGGIDIASVATVVSTLDGQVEYSFFENQFLGGVVYIVSDSGLYKAAFIHLADAGRPQEGSYVHRGDPIGSTYNDFASQPLKFAEGPHVHYQVLRSGVNWGFASSLNHAGPCQDPFIEPSPAPTCSRITCAANNPVISSSQVAPACK